MKILFTVGTTPFPELEYSALDLSNFSNHQIHFQTPSSMPNSKFNKLHWFEYYAGDPVRFLQKFDYVVSHAGTGTIFNLLKSRTKFCVVPNLDRQDSHQSEICEWLALNKYAKIIYNPRKITQFILNGRWQKFTPNHYEPSQFKVNELLLHL